jgi:hypothetical protein
MKQPLREISVATVLITAMLFAWACAETATTVGSGNSQDGSQTSVAGELRYKAQEGWVTEKPSSNMRAAQYKLPKAEGDSEDASLVLYYFGQGQGGSVADNINRWIDQMQQPDGRPSREKARTETLTINGLRITTVDISGTYVAQMSPGSDARHNDPGYRLRAAVVETPKGNYFAKLIGPGKTVSKWDQSFNEYVKSFEFK